MLMRSQSGEAKVNSTDSKAELAADAKETKKRTLMQKTK
jgi:hypothetical protein